MNENRRFLAEYFVNIHGRIFFICGFVMLCSELWKQITLATLSGHFQYNWWYFPFQLCSIPMYLSLLYPFVRRNVQHTLTAFFMTYTLLGGIAVFADTSGLHYPVTVLTVHSYLWHILLIIMGIGSGCIFLYRFFMQKKRTGFSRPSIYQFSFRPFFYATGLYFVLCLTAEILNLSLDRFGTINMFYINPHYQMQQVIFRELVPLIGNPAAICLYIIMTVFGAFILFLIWRILFLFLARR